MIKIDLHTHTHYAHGSNTVEEMFLKGKELGLEIHGFSEHSPRPLGYDYPHEYRDKLLASLPFYVSEVKKLKTNQSDVKVLFAMEIDWIEEEKEFVTNTTKLYDFDYLIGGIHFLDTWGFDADKKDWDILSYEEKTKFYSAYYKTMKAMIQSNLFQIIAHPDLIKIFSICDFKTWLKSPSSLLLIEDTLKEATKYNIALEISSAGLRKPCKEIYPCPEIMEIAQSLKLPITFASDGHCTNTLAQDFNQLEAYAKKFGYTYSMCFEKNKQWEIKFS